MHIFGMSNITDTVASMYHYASTAPVVTFTEGSGFSIKL